MEQNYYLIDTSTGAMMVDDARRDMDDSMSVYKGVDTSIERMTALALAGMVYFLTRYTPTDWVYIMPCILMAISLYYAWLNAGNMNIPGIGIPPRTLYNTTYINTSIDPDYLGKQMIYLTMEYYHGAITRINEVNAIRQSIYRKQKYYVVMAILSYAIIFLLLVSLA